MKTLKVIIALIGFIFSFNSQVFSIECDVSKFSKAFYDLKATQWGDVVKRVEFASYSVCGEPIKADYEIVKKQLKEKIYDIDPKTGKRSAVDLEDYEGESGAKLAEKLRREEEERRRQMKRLAIKCDFNKYIQTYKALAGSGWGNDVSITEEFVKYSVCGGQIKSMYEDLKNSLKMIDLQAYENKVVHNMDFVDCNGGGDNNGSTLQNATFENVDLRNCKFPKVFLINSKFINVNLKGQDFSKIMMGDLIFKGSNLEGVNFSGTQLYNAIIMNSSLIGAKFNEKTEFIRVRILNNKLDDDLLREILVWYLFRPEDGECIKPCDSIVAARNAVNQEYEKYLQKNIKTGVILLHRSNLITDEELGTILSTHPYKK